MRTTGLIWGGCGIAVLLGAASCAGTNLNEVGDLNSAGSGGSSGQTSTLGGALNGAGGPGETGGQPNDNPTDHSAGSAGSSGEASTPGGALNVPGGPAGAGGQSNDNPSESPLCAAPGGTEITFGDEAEAQSDLVGIWVLCSGPGLAFATEQHSQAGVELSVDMHWYALIWDGSALVRASGFQASGTYRFQPPQDLQYGPSQEAMLFFGADYSFNTLTMLDAPRKLRWQFTSPINAAPSIYARQSP